jgi:GNAT superfamily N-acetyltransferase
MDIIAERLQQCIIASQTRPALQVGPYSVHLHPTDDAVENNVAMPGKPDIVELMSWLESLREAFAAQGRIPAIQWLEGYAPELSGTLREVGFSENHREILLIYTAKTLPSVSHIPGLSLIEITDSSPISDVRENLDVNEFGFNPVGAVPATDEQATEFRATLGSARTFTAKLSGQAASAGMYTAPQGGVTQLVGIATLEALRGQGLAGALTARMAETALERGCDLVFLKTGNPAARRAYERAGFEPKSAVLTYVAGGLAANEHGA